MAMKDSGIDWIGEIPNAWKISKLKYVSEFVNGDRGANYPSGDDLVDDGIIFVTSNNIHGTELDNSPSISKYITKQRYDLLGGAKLEINDIIFCLRGSVGVCAINTTETEGTIASSLVDIKPRLIDTHFMNFFLQSEISKFQTDLYTNGSCAANLSADNVSNYYFIEPNIEEQQLIADFLDDKVGKIDDILTDLNKQVEILTAYKKSLITETVTKGLNPNAPMKESGIDWIGKIPEHWNIKKLKYLLKPNCVNMRVGPFGSALSGDDFKDEGYWVYNQRCVLDKNFETNDTFVDEYKYKELNAFTVDAGDILITTRGTIGKVAIVPKNCPVGILHPCIIKFVMNQDLINNELVELIFNNSNMIMDQIMRKSNATTIDVIYSYTLKDLLLPVIPMDEQKEIIDFLDKKCAEIDGLISDKTAQIDKMEKYKKSLIFEYVTGKKRVKEVV